MTKRYGMGEERKGTSPILLDKAMRQLSEQARQAIEDAKKNKKIKKPKPFAG